MKEWFTNPELPIMLYSSFILTKCSKYWQLTAGILTLVRRGKQLWLFLFWANQSLLLLLNAACLAENQYIPILFWFDPMQLTTN